MRFKIEIILACLFGGLALTGLILPILGWIFLGVAGLVGVDIVTKQAGRSLQFKWPLAFPKKTVAATKSLPLGVEFHETRPDIKWFKQKLGQTRTAWGAWMVGGAASNYGVLSQTRFQRLILLDPTGSIVTGIADVAKRQSGELSEQIRALMKSASKQGSEVKYCSNLPYSLLVFGDPPMPGESVSDEAWIQVEVFLPGLEADQRPCFVVYGKNRALYQRLYESYLAIWEHSRVAEPGPSLPYR